MPSLVTHALLIAVLAASAPSGTEDASAFAGVDTLQAGSRLADAELLEVDRHPEFRRLTFRLRDGTMVGLEVTRARVVDSNATEGVVVQPAPGSSLPPAALLEAVRRLAAGGADAGRPAPSPNTDTRTQSPTASGDADAPRRTPTATGAAPTALPVPALQGLALVLLLALGAWRLQGVLDAPPRWKDIAAPLAGGLGAALVALVLLEWLVPDFVLFHDPLRDLALANDCRFGHACGTGADTTLPGIAQGALWVRLLGALLGAGVPLDGLRHAVLALHALGAGVLVAHLVRVTKQPALAALLAAAWLLGVEHGVNLPVLWNPALVPLAGVLFAVAAARALETRHLLDVAVAALSLTLVVEAHIVALLLVPAWLAVVVATSARPVAAFLLTLVPVGLFHVALSPVTVAHHLARFGGPGLALGALGLLVAVAGGGWARRRRPSPPAALAVVPLAYVVSLVVLARHSPDGVAPRYLVVALAPALVAAASAWAARRMRAPRLATWAGAALLIVAVVATAPDRNRAPASPVGLAHAERLSAVLRRFGPPEALAWSLHAADAATWVELVGATPPGDEAPAREPEALAVLFTQGATVPHAGWESAPLGGGFSALVHPYTPWVRRSPVRACDARGICTTVARPPSTPSRWGPVFARRIALPLDGAPATVTFDVDPGAPGETRVLRLLPTVPEDCQFTVREVSGVRFDGTLPASRIVLHGGGPRGTLTVSAGTTPCRSLRGALPSWLELEPADAWAEALGEP